MPSGDFMKHKRKYFSGFLRFTGVIAIILCFYLWLTALDARQREAGRLQLETALRRSAAACYAAEGFYPPDIQYLEEHYGLQVDESRYRVFYEVFAPNLMPEITVLEKTP